MANYTLRQLKYFVTTAKCGSVAEASRKLYIAQPSISTAIKGLEDNFGVQLFIRHHAQGVSLTPSGTRFYSKAQKLLRMAHIFEQNALADNDMISGQISIGCFETVAPLILPKLIRGFKTLYPGIETIIRDGEQHELVQKLTTGSLDVALLYRHDLNDNLSTDMLAAPRKPYVLLPANHQFAQQTQISLADLAAEPMILLDVLPSRHYFVNLFTRIGITPNIVFSSPSIEMVRGMVGQGLGFAILVTRPHGKYSYDGQPLATLELKDEVEGSGLVAAWLTHNQLTKPAQLFVEFCKSELANVL
ncbi:MULTISPECIES: LysR family transcriptional regulator [unclassified Serratia (in: enterobacteria)]|uniref:LysR family transcriptional regulator n=1 Tax=unclassified Serratia (in: enterobacteria) TaxID=2647522 RepID=UPI0005046B3D|nr:MULTISPECIES: LysR family transcriptional regulator [unclassified Serratia (in: enterobacteria)]KFK94082.1 LysR family transcriptional regulator [Serratia sp. Ag2]KFL00581.1 LysR family transcriptional regulator [Serratia sp. Ag1]